MKRIFLGIIGLTMSVGAAALTNQSYVVKYADELDLSGMCTRYDSRVTARMNVNGGELFVGEAKFERGIGTSPDCAVAFKLDGNAISFNAVVGLDKTYRQYMKKGTEWQKIGAYFNVWVDGKLVWKSGLLWADRNDMKEVHVNLKGAKEIVLESAMRVEHWFSIDPVMANWGDAKLVLKDGAVVTAIEPERFAQHGILTPPESAAPRFNGADIWGVRPGKPVIFRVPVSGKRPMTLTAENLPEGVTFDSQFGTLSGKAPEQPGDYVITVTAKNAHGEAKRNITLRVGKMLAITPPMGWNSWNIGTRYVTGDFVRRMAKAMHESGLADYGYGYVNIDDCWMRNEDKWCWRNDMGGALRDENGRILPNASFPDMKGLVDEIHSYGFKAGIYSSPGKKTCTGCAGSLGYEKQDAEQYAEWGFDCLKYDCCSYREEIIREIRELKEIGVTNINRAVLREKPYALMGGLLAAQPRDILFSLGQGGYDKVQEWGRTSAGGSMFRSDMDLKDSWMWLYLTLNNDYMFQFSHPGFWADPDMMVVGWQRSFGSEHNTYLRANEQYTHVSVWALVSSPILLGCDMSKLDSFTKALLCNSEIIDMHQDRLGKAAKCVVKTPDCRIWVKEMANGDKVVGLLNVYYLSRNMKIDFEKLGLGKDSEWHVRDLWRQRDMGLKRGGFDAPVLGHMTEIWRLSPITSGVNCK